MASRDGFVGAFWALDVCDADDPREDDPCEDEPYEDEPCAAEPPLLLAELAEELPPKEA